MREYEYTVACTRANQMRENERDTNGAILRDAHTENAQRSRDLSSPQTRERTETEREREKEEGFFFPKRKTYDPNLLFSPWQPRRRPFRQTPHPLQRRRNQPSCFSSSSFSTPQTRRPTCFPSFADVKAGSESFFFGRAKKCRFSESLLSKRKKSEERQNSFKEYHATKSDLMCRVF